ncbi:MAG: AAA family ATPase, partial [Oligoflexales bacterium]|nr:AAA family ATPase [Oligoflexales bacterium]
MDQTHKINSEIIVTDDMMIRRFSTSPLLNSREIIVSALAKFSEINHPNVMQIIETNVDEGEVTIKIALPSGLNLAMLQKRKITTEKISDAPISIRDALNIGIGLADALRACHAGGIYHGNIKPADIYFRSADLKDFVLLGFENSLILKGVDEYKISDIPYLPPECMGFLTTEDRAAIDLYGIGAVLYELISGRAPFMADSKEDLCQNILKTLPLPIDKIEPDIVPFYEVIQKLLRKTPKDRYGSACGLHFDLLRCRESLDAAGKISPFALGKKDPRRELNYKIPTVGREKIFSQLRDSLNSTIEGRGSLITIGAHSGIGKTRLAEDILDEAAKMGFHTYQAKFTQYERNIPLATFNKVLVDFESILTKMNKSQYIKWQEILLAQLSENGSLLAERFPYLEKHFPPFPGLGPVSHEIEVRLVRETITNLITLLTLNGKGTMIFLDDLQWADETSIKLLMEIAAASNSGRLRNTTILCTYRSEEVGGEHLFSKLVLGRLSMENNILLEPLDKSQSDRLVRLLLDDEGEDIDKIAGISFDLTQGNPFHIYSYLNNILESRLYRLDEGNNYFFDLEHAKQREIGKEVGELVKERINCLSADAFHLISTISVAGSSISLPAAEYLLVEESCKSSQFTSEKAKKFNIDMILNELIQKNLLTLRGGNDIRFVHDRVRDGAWGFCSEQKKRDLHRDYAYYLVRNIQNIENLETKMIFEIAFHIQNGSPQRDTSISRRILHHAGKRAASLFSYQKTKEYLDSATQFFPESESELKKAGLFGEWIALKELYADALSMSRQLYDAISLYKMLVSMIDDNDFRVAKICGKISRNYLWLFDYPRSLFWGRKGLEMIGGEWVLTVGRSILKMLIWLPVFLIRLAAYNIFKRRRKVTASEQEAFLLSFQIDLMVPAFFYKPITAIANMLKIAAIALSYPETPFIMMAYAYWGVVLALYGFDRLSVKIYEKALRYFESNYDPHAVAFLYFTRGNLFHYTRGNMEKAVSDIEHTVRICEEIGDTFWLFLSYQALNHIGYHGGKTYFPALLEKKLTDLWGQVKYEYGILGSLLRHKLAKENYDDLNVIMGEMIKEVNETSQKGYYTIDIIYRSMQPGEIYLFLEEAKKAIPPLKIAFKGYFNYLHRVPFCCLAPLLLARA